MRLTVRETVTTDDIAEGKRLDSGRCPVARAVERFVRRAFPTTPLRVSVGLSESWLDFLPDQDDQIALRALHPATITDWIERFDDGHAVSPIPVELVFTREN